MFERVLILSASAGAGHIRAAQAVEKAFLQLKAAKELRNIDTLDYTNKLFQNLYSKAYIELVDKAPAILGWLYDYFNEPWQNQHLHLAFDKLNVGPLIKLLTEFKPTLAVCTHYLPAEIISWLKEKRRLRTRQAIIITDFDLHAMWLCRNYEHYFVALEETRLHLEALGISPEKITVSGIPIDPVFAEKKDKTEMRKKLGLDINLPAILISAGGFGVGPMEMLVRSLTKMHNKAQVIAICGKNEELKTSLKKLKSGLARNNTLKVFPVGFTTEMDEYMSAADLLLGKPGGLTTSEALAKSLPLVIVNPIRGQEERNSDHLLEEGAAIRCNNLPVLGYKIDSLLDNPQRLELMRKNVRRLARPNAALDIVKKLLSLQNS
ncbi:MAG: glycosyltransferase [Planctomycetes bacterium]|nr:glycosyltransferase [Planctomycetota bacterium]